MTFIQSQIDKKNSNWFENDTTRRSLLRLEIGHGELRGLSQLKLRFRYPITALSGKNGTGKSTVLACVACAFHNKKNGYNPLLRRETYYTFSDFFVQSAEELTPKGISISYQFLHDKWRSIQPGPGWQIRKKRLRGKWSNYDSRLKRNVVYLGIDRIVPHAEKSVLKSNRKAFQKGNAEGYEEKVRDIVGRIIGKQYDDFYFRKHFKYRLPVVSSDGRVYSGFNMGAGEKALFEIFSIIYGCDESLLLVIDEIELGLHEEAQNRLIDALKEVVAERRIQIICTTHSPTVLSKLPPDARIHLEKQDNSVNAFPQISPQYAAGLMSGTPQAELDILCEDIIASNILLYSLPNNIRARVRIIPIGSNAAVVRHLAFRFKEDSGCRVCGILDGDQSARNGELVKLFLKSLETVEDETRAIDWINKSLTFIPGDTWPEEWILNSIGDISRKKLAIEFGVSIEAIKEYIKHAQLAGKHSEFYVLSKKLSFPIESITTRFISCALQEREHELQDLRQRIQGFLQ